ncbi:MAG TPA: hypothetical protein VJT81_01780 [Burkholderiales bacterium]|nr:hypothetical protein [Burkholderiales bacterium]
MKENRFDLSSLDFEALALVYGAMTTFAVSDAAERRAARFGLDLKKDELQRTKRKLEAAAFQELTARTREVQS